MITPDPIRVLIAEDSATIRYFLTGIIDQTPPLHVVGAARDGAEAVDMANELEPHVISMDVNMPVMDGLEATRRIMRLRPTPVVIVSGLVDREIDLSFRALQAGALAVVPKPPARTSAMFEQQRRQLVTTLEAMAGVRVIRRWASMYEVTRHDPTPYQTAKIRQAPLIVGVAASAGGPSALATLISNLHNELNVPMVVVQHMPGEFLAGLARWLARFTDIPVRLAADNEILAPGVVHLAPEKAHLRIERRGHIFVAHLDPNPGKYRFQPAADVLFESMSEASGERGVGVVLTGMGSDGADGLLAMRRAGARTFAQDEESATVFGMPGAAIERGAVERIMSPAQIAAALRKLL